MRTINLIVIHCSATPNAQPITPAVIDAGHKARGFRRDPKLIGAIAPSLKHIGYHYFIAHNGPVTVCRGEQEVGAHVQGHNANSIGICMVGTCLYSAEQWASLRGLVQALKGRYPNARVTGHRDLSPDTDGDGKVERHEWLKTCPGFDVAAWLARDRQPLPEQVLTTA